MRIGFVGLGALGSVFAQALRPVATVHAVVRHEAPSLALTGVDAVLVAVKSYDTVAALQPLRGILRDDVPVISLQNGLEQVEQITSAFGSARAIALAPTTEAANRDPSGVSHRVGRGETAIGWAAGRTGTFDLAGFAALLNSAGLVTHEADPIEPHVWAKAVVNAALNPVTALAGEPNGYVVENRAAGALAGVLACEAAAVAAAGGILLPFDDPAAYVLGIARATASNRSSMLQDIDRKRPTEIDAITGAIVRRGRALGVPTPENARMLAEIHRVSVPNEVRGDAGP
jgi:2-dehydropantoate 2-reductase